MKKLFLFFVTFLFALVLFAQKDTVIRKKDRKRDVLLQTSMGDMVLRLSDSTPLHRDNFLMLVKTSYYDSLLFHRVMESFMIQGGDPNSKSASPGILLGNGGPANRIPAEFRYTLIHKKGALGAARDGNPEKASSGSQFYIVQGKVWTDAGLDSTETIRLQRKIPIEHREIYKTTGGSPHLDQTYTVFGQLVKGLDVLDKIAAVPVSKGKDLNRPLTDVRIISAKLIKRKKF